MKQQLRFTVPYESEWKIDEETRRIGQVGVAAARTALNSVQPPAPRQDQAPQPTSPPKPPVQGRFPFDWRTESGDPF